eukprot:m.67486 g.67486  ORF g.67486 m.67486 type:complete len:99 (+) comp23820_c0_seq1:388-684(+)
MGCCGSSVKEEDEHVDERTNLLSSQSHLSNTNGKSINGESSGPPLSIPDARYNEEEEEADPLNILQTKLDLIAHKFERWCIRYHSRLVCVCIRAAQRA